jgi:hypothetical protein
LRCQMKPPFLCPSQIDAKTLGVRGKKTYETRAAAEAAAEQLKASAYHCVHCGKWHLATRRTRATRRNRRK